MHCRHNLDFLGPLGPSGPCSNLIYAHCYIKRPNSEGTEDPGLALEHLAILSIPWPCVATGIDVVLHTSPRPLMARARDTDKSVRPGQSPECLPGSPFRKLRPRGVTVRFRGTQLPTADLSRPPPPRNLRNPGRQLQPQRASRAPRSPEQVHLQSLALALRRLNTSSSHKPRRPSSTVWTQGPPSRVEEGRTAARNPQARECPLARRRQPPPALQGPAPAPPSRVPYLVAFPRGTPDVIGGSCCLIHVRRKLGTDSLPSKLPWRVEGDKGARLPEARWVLPLQPSPGDVSPRQVSAGPLVQGCLALQPEPEKEKQLLGPRREPGRRRRLRGRSAQGCLPGKQSRTLKTRSASKSEKSSEEGRGAPAGAPVAKSTGDGREVAREAPPGATAQGRRGRGGGGGGAGTRESPPAMAEDGGIRLQGRRCCPGLGSAGPHLRDRDQGVLGGRAASSSTSFCPPPLDFSLYFPFTFGAWEVLV
ncbi:proline-rich protein 36-like [Sus scrofa]|uniref:proline-rich protein 36-like n=1 Tax=Sus scrofa TaxID=9823 RepID=UPI000A2B8C5C|nr:proline-rich protein 36-like [Sus scrofa]